MGGHMPYAPPSHNSGIAKLIKRAIARDYSQKKRAALGGNEFYSKAIWKRARKQFALDNPLCVDCLKLGITRLLDVVDHIDPIKSGGALLDFNNLQGLCHLHHNQKTVRDKENIIENVDSGPL